MATLELSTPIMGSRPGFDEEVILDHMEEPDERDRDALKLIKKYSNKMGIDPAAPSSQFLVETGDGTSDRYQDENALAGVGIVADDTEQPFILESLDESARLFLQCLYSLVNRKPHPDVKLDGDSEKWFNDVWLPKVRSSAMPNVETIADLGLRYKENGRSRATWSWEKGTGPMDAYGKKLKSRLAAFYPNLPDRDEPVETPSTPEEPIGYNYENGVKPADTVYYPVAEGRKYAGYIDPDDHWVGICFIHSAYGLLQGTSVYMAQGNALTDSMVGNMLDGPALNGEMREYNDPYGNRYAHASGPVDRPIDDAAKFLEIFGPNPGVINMHGSAIEQSCTSSGGGQVSEEEHDSRVRRIAWLANNYGKYLYKKTGEHQFTCDTFPLIPSQNNRSFLAYHGEANAGKRNTCPTPQVRATLNRIIADVRALLTKWQKNMDTSTPEPENPNPQDQYAKAKVIPELQAYLGDDEDGNPIPPPAIVTVGKRIYVMVNDRVEALKATPRRQTAEDDADVIGPDIAKGTQFAALWMFQTDDGKPWYITPWWTRVPVADTKRVSDTP